MRALRLRPFGLLGLLCVLLGSLAVACGGGSKPADRVHVLTWDGDVNPVMERYIDRGIDTAEESNARAVVIRLDTPGGQVDTMRHIVQRIEAARIPVIVYVSPAGARAASAGTFITMAGNIAAMAPNTAIGAATPIDSSGEDIEGALGRKVTNDSVAFIRGIAELRGRNADWAESAVRDAVSVSSSEAVSLDIVDFVADSMDDLLAKSDGRQVQVAGADGGFEPVTVRTAGAQTADNNPTILEDFLNLLASPNIAFLLLTLGTLAILSEIFHQSGFGAVVGSISLVLAYFSLGAIDPNWAGAVLIVIGLALLTAEAFVPSFGILGFGGIAALVFGGIILTSGDGEEVSRWLIAIVAVFATFVLLVLGMVLLSLRKKPSTVKDLVGATGMTRTALNLDGVVQVAGERWDATSEDGPIDAETHVIVTAKHGLRLQVKRDPAFIRMLPAPSTTGAPDGPA